MKKKLITAIVILLILAGCGKKRDILTSEERGWLEAHKNNIVISCDPGWPPFEYTENGNFTGFSSEYINLIEKRLGLKFVFRPAESWKQVMTGFKERKIDIVPSIGEESTRKDYMIFTKSYYSVSTAIIVNSDEKRNLTLKEMKGKSVGVTMGYDTITTYLQKNYPEIQIEFIPNPQTGLRAVSAGLLDAIVESPGVAIYYIKKEGIKNIRFAGNGECRWILRMGVRSDYPLLRNILNKVISDISDTERDKMLNRWSEGRAIGRSQTFINTLRILSGIIIAAIAGIVIFMFRSRIIKFFVFLKSSRVVFLSSLIIILIAFFIYFLFQFNSKKQICPGLSDSEKQWLMNTESIRFCPNPAAPPLSYLDTNGNYTGLTIDYIREIEKFTGKEFEFIKVKSFAELMEKLKNGSTDIAGPVQKTTERERFLYFSTPYVDAATVIITRADSPDYDTLEKLRGVRLSVTEGYTIQKYLKEKYPYLTVEPVSNDFTGLLRVSFGESDAVIADIIASSYIITREGIGNLKISGFTDLNYSLCFAVNRNLPVLNSIINKAMQSIDVKRKREISEKWIGLKGHPLYTSRNFWIVLAGSLSFLVFIIVTVLSWNISLKAKVRERTRELELALSEVKTLQGFIPICSGCKKIRDDSGYWTQVEEYIESRSGAQFSHGLCPDCVKRLYPDLKLKE